MIPYYDGVVLGLGGVGSQAIRSLARNGVGGRFLGVEAYRLGGHNIGSSHGRTRIYRCAYFEHDNYVPWCQYSVDVFKQMEMEHKKSFLISCGVLLMEESIKPYDKTPTKNSLPPILKASYGAATKHSIPIEYLNANELRERYTQFTGTSSMVGIYEPNTAGFVRCEDIIKAAQQDATARRTNDDGGDGGVVDIFEETRASSWKTLDDGTIELSLLQRQQRKTENNDDDSEEEQDDEELIVVQTKKLVLSIGGWTGQLIPSWKPYLRPIRQLQSFLKVHHDDKDDDRRRSSSNSSGNDNDNNDPSLLDLYSYTHMPSWFMFHPKYPLPQYGIPCDINDSEARQWLKIAIHGRDDYLTHPTINHRKPVSLAETNEAYNACKLVFDLDKLAGRRKTSGEERASSTTLDKDTFATIIPCFYTMTPDQHFLLGTPKLSGLDNRYNPNIFVTAGLSGHGYKMTPALGQMMSDFILDNNDMSHWKIDFCSPNRFGI